MFNRWEILSDLRNLQPLLTKTIDTMPLVYDLNKDVRFNQGIKKGIEKMYFVKSPPPYLASSKKRKIFFRNYF